MTDSDKPATYSHGRPHYYECNVPGCTVQGHHRETPATAAGQRALLHPPGSLDEWRETILAIEAEAAAPAAAFQPRHAGEPWPEYIKRVAAVQPEGERLAALDVWRGLLYEFAGFVRDTSNDPHLVSEAEKIAARLVSEGSGE